MNLKKYTFTIISIIALVAHVFAEKTDIIFLENNDRITGEVKKLEYGKLTLKTNDMSTVLIEWENIRQIKTKDKFEVELKDGTLFFGTLNESPYSMRIRIIQNGSFQDIFRWHIVRITPIKDRFVTRLNGNLDIGFSYTKASEVQQFNFGGDISYRSRIHFVQLKLTSVQTSQPEKDKSMRQSADLLANRYLQNRNYVIAKTTLERNSEMGIDLRVLMGGGLGHDVIKSNSNTMMLVGGVLLNRENTTNTAQSTSVEAIANILYSLFIFADPKTNLDATLALFPNLSTWGRLRVEHELRLNWEFIKDYTLSITYHLSFDNQPVSQDAEKQDWDILLGLGWSL